MLVESAHVLGFAWDSAEKEWLRRGLLALMILASPFLMLGGLRLLLNLLREKA